MQRRRTSHTGSSSWRSRRFAPRADARCCGAAEAVGLSGAAGATAGSDGDTLGLSSAAGAAASVSLVGSAAAAAAAAAGCAGGSGEPPPAVLAIGRLDCGGDAAAAVADSCTGAGCASVSASGQPRQPEPQGRPFFLHLRHLWAPLLGRPLGLTVGACGSCSVWPEAAPPVATAGCGRSVGLICRAESGVLILHPHSGVCTAHLAGRRSRTHLVSHRSNARVQKYERRQTSFWLVQPTLHQRTGQERGCGREPSLCGPNAVWVGRFVGRGGLNMRPRSY